MSTMKGTLGSAMGQEGRIVAKKAARKGDERSRPPAAYRAEELAVMRRQFFAPRAAVY
ncbi:hypothetical protein ACFYS8_06525 [Kitasatospora sp. NPDC004615]|uniref:hypothetical protein n=1 Tax=Kitasatospora sp. NPDC004615 TaxID=3364017 RepID=UPI0036D199F2